MNSIGAYIDDLSGFITASPSPFHAVSEVARRLTSAGYTRVFEHEPWPGESTRTEFTVRDGALIAWALPAAASAITPFNIVGTHTDSPTFTLKPRPTIETHGWWQAGVEVYGAPLINSWLDRELELAGRLVARDGTAQLVRSGPLLRIAQLAHHLDPHVDKSLSLDRQEQLRPLIGLSSSARVDVIEILADFARLNPADVAGFDVVVADTAPPTRFGLGKELFAAGRMDNLVSVHAGVVALLNTHEDSGHVRVLAAFDHEEVGSASRSGAKGPFLDDVLSRITQTLGATASQRQQAFSRSVCVSADVGHGLHPNYADRHDPASPPSLDSGPLLKFNANQQYATDAVGAAYWRRICDRADVPIQDFVSHNAVPCGSTIGPLTATRLGIRTVDIGMPLLSMHSARELCHVSGPLQLKLAMEAFFASDDDVNPDGRYRAGAS